METLMLKIKNRRLTENKMRHSTRPNWNCETNISSRRPSKSECAWRTD